MKKARLCGQAFCQWNIFLRIMKMAAMIATMAASPSTAQKPHGVPAKGTGTFIPYREAMIVGMDSSAVREVSIFMVMFRLLLITDANASVVLDMMSR